MTFVTLAYSDVCKLRVALVRQEMLTRSRSPDFICLPFAWRIHFAVSFGHFSPYWPSMKVLCRNAWWHIFVGNIFDFFLLFFNVVIPCLSLFWYGLVIHFERELLAPSWCCASFCLSFLVHLFGGYCIWGMCCLSSGIHAVCCDCYLSCQNMDSGLMENDFVYLTSDSLTTFDTA